MSSQGGAEGQREFRCEFCEGKILIPKDLPPTAGPCPHCQKTITSPAPESGGDPADDPIFGRPVQEPEKKPAAAPPPLPPALVQQSAEAKAKEAKRLEEEKAKAKEAKRLAEEKAKAEEAKRLAEEKAKAEEAKRLEEEKAKAEEAKRLEEEKAKAEEAKRLEEEKAKAKEAKRLAEEKAKAEEAKRLAEEKAKAEEAKRLAEEKAKAEEAKRLAEEKAKAEEAKRLAEEAKRLAEEKAKAEEAKRLAEEKAKAEEAKRLAEEKAKAEEAKRLAEEKAKAEEAKRLAEEKAKAEEAKRLAEEKAKAEEAKRLEEEEAKAEEAKRLAEEKAKAEEAKRLAEEKAKAEEARRLEEEKAKAEEAKRLEEEKAKAEEAKRLEEEKAKAEEAKRLAEEKAKAEEAKRLAEEKAKSEETKREEEEQAVAKKAPVAPGSGEDSKAPREKLAAVPVASRTEPGKVEQPEKNPTKKAGSVESPFPEKGEEDPFEDSGSGPEDGARRKRSLAPLMVAATLCLLAVAVGFLVFKFRDLGGGGAEVDAAEVARIREEQYLRKGWEEDAYEVLDRFLKSDTAAGKAAHSIRGSEMLAEMEEFYGGGRIDDSDTPASAFAVHTLPIEDRRRGIFMMVYDQPPVFEMSEFFSPIAPLDVQYGVREPGILLASVSRVRNFTGEPLKVWLFFRRSEEGLRIDWETYAQTKYRTLRDFLEIPESGRTGTFRVFIKETVPDPGMKLAGSRTYQVADPAHSMDRAKVVVPVDSDIGRALSIINWRGTKQGRAFQRNATVELGWSDEAVPRLVLSRFICWEFLGVGGNASDGGS